MPTKKRLTDGGALIEFSRIDLQKVEKLLKLLDDCAVGAMEATEVEWLSNALDLFAPTNPPGEYPL